MSDTQTPEPRTDIALLPPVDRAVVVLKSTETEKNLLALVERTKPIGAPVDKAGREEVHRAAMDHKNARVAIQTAGKTAREDATAFSKAVIAEQDRLVAINAKEEARLFGLRDTYDAAEATRKAEEERKERERVAAIREKIDAIKSLPVVSAADNAETLAATLGDLRGFEITFEDFAEFQDEARAARDASIASLTAMHAAASAREAAEAALAAQREEIERQQRALAEQQEEIARQRAELEEAQKAAAAPAVVVGPNEPPPEVVGTVKSAYDPGNWRDCNPPPIDDTLLEFEAERKASLTALDQPRQRAENAAVAYMLDNTPPSPLSESERRVIVAPESGTAEDGSQVEIRIAPDAPEAVSTFFDAAAGPDTTVEMVTITRDEYDSLLTRVHWLDCLEAAGVDKWDGIEEALRINREGTGS